MTTHQESESTNSLANPELKPGAIVNPETRAVEFDETMTFADLPDLNDKVRKAVEELGWTNPTPVQQMCLPLTLQGRDVAGFAQTGTGKTGVFLISVAHRLLSKERGEGNGPRAIVLAPTRELAMQINNDAAGVLNALGISSMAVFGGIDYDKQAKQLRQGVDVVVATPGRLKDYLQKKALNMNSIEMFVCDEADRMFDMGFIEDVEFFLDKLPETTQKLLFSATTNENVKELAFEYLEKPEYISVNPETITPENIDQRAIICNSQDKLKVLLGLIRDDNPACAIIFCNTKLVCEWLHFKLTHNGVEADLITGDLPQRKRIQLIKRIKEQKIKALVATDVASRGLHISNLSHVYNFDLPTEPANYVHRIGRTARAGAKGVATALVCEDYGSNLQEINELLGHDFALRSQWFDQKYLEIEDKAGDPFANRNQEHQSEDRPRRREQHEGRGERKDGRKGASARDDNRQQQGKGRGKGKDQGREGRQDNRGERQGQARDKKRGKPRHDRDRDRSRHHDKPFDKQAAAQNEPATPKGAGQMIKKIFSTIFGRKK